MVVYLKDEQSGIFEDKFEYKYHILGEKIINEFIETSIDVFVGQSINFDKNNPFGGKEEPDMSDM